jgi:diguanylate cyclase (GGDEF)-like protein
MSLSASAVSKPRILLVDDSRPIREEIRGVLRDHGLDAIFFEAENGLEGFKFLLDHPVDLVLCDLIMPQMDGFKFLQMRATPQMRASRPDLQDVPVLMLTAIEDMEQKVHLLTSGAADYITKPFHQEELVARVNIHLKIKRLQDELKQKNELLTELSTTDSLTKIYNRRHFMDLAHREYQRSERQGFQVSMLLFDVDQFKKINDGLGHQVGDEVLVEVCALAQQTFRKYDILGRYGGDEFTVLFPQTSMKQALRVCQRFAVTVSEMQFLSAPGSRITISGGVAEKTSATDNVEKLIKFADDALYRAKAEGRNRVLAAF